MKQLAPMLVACLLLSACGKEPRTNADTSTPQTDFHTISGGPESVTPYFIPVAELKDGDRFTVEAHLKGSIVVSAGEDYSKWDASGYDTSVLRFTKGFTDGSATFNPGFKAIGLGETEFSLTDGTRSIRVFVRVVPWIHDRTPDAKTSTNAER